MRRPFLAILLSAPLAALSLAASCRAAEDHSSRGAELLAPFKRELQGALQAGLQEGAVAAIDSCRVRAPDIAAALSTDGVRVGRSSHRLRNPANRGPAWVQPILGEYLADSASRTPREVALPEGRVGYVEPIALQPLCTVCHGASLSAEVGAAISALYPDDQATGFAVGDLRGVFWAEFPAGY